MLFEVGNMLSLYCKKKPWGINETFSMFFVFYWCPWWAWHNQEHLQAIEMFIIKLTKILHLCRPPTQWNWNMKYYIITIVYYVVRCWHIHMINVSIAISYQSVLCNFNVKAYLMRCHGNGEHLVKKISYRTWSNSEKRKNKTRIFQ